MNGDKVRQWFDRSAALPPGVRKRFVESLCPDPDVRSEVLSLLEHYSEDTDDDVFPPLVPVIRQMVANSADKTAQRSPVTRVGPFQLGSLLGSGGMGAVYGARRTDGEVDQRVAVKFARVPPGTPSDMRSAVFRRFARERQALAALRHPYIAGLIDAGTAEDGTPYAIIEQVDGVTIDAYCDSYVPDIAGRIRLFLKLCEAVQFAHRNLIVHSDIKPSNVLVTSDGIPKLIDFGIASDLGDDATRTQPRAFTLEYASPEQLLGSKVTVLTDVYGLGAVLYRLLTGAKLRDLQDLSLSDIMRSAWQHDLRRPSTLRPELKGDLENILLKALEVEPQDRYGSVPEFADDLNRFLEGRPVRASPDSILYRSRRFVRRHWLVLGLSASMSVALAATAIIATFERRHAEQSAAETRSLANRLLFEIQDGNGGARVREKLSALAFDHLRSLERTEDRDPELRWELLNAYTRLASSRSGGYSSIGDAETGARLAAKALELGIKVEQSSPDRERLGKLFDLYEELAGISHEGGRREQQRAAIDRMLRLAEHLEPCTRARALVLLARYLDDHGPESEAADAYARALSILRELAAHPANAAAVEPKLISTLVGFGRAQALKGEFRDATTTLQEAITRSKRRMASGPNAVTARQLYWSHIALGDVFGNPARFSLEQPEQAVEQYQKARAIAQQLAGADPDNEVARMDLARAYGREGAALAYSRPAEALKLFDRFHTVISRSRSNGPSVPEARISYLTDCIGPLILTGNQQRAAAYLAEARQMLAGLQGANGARSRYGVLRAEAMLLHSLRQRTAALERAHQLLAMHPAATNPVLSANFEKIKLLEQMRRWSAGSDAAVFISVTRQLEQIWRELEAAYPASAFIKAQARRLRTLDR